MLEQWIAAFRTGTHTDSEGNTKTWTEKDLDEIVSKYNPAEHESPEVIGHPKTNAPAFGWVAALKRVGEFLYYKPKDRAPEFVEMLKKKLFKKRSISVYPDGTLKHIGWLGANPPAVKGLPDVEFKEDEEFFVYEFQEEEKKYLPAADVTVRPEHLEKENPRKEKNMLEAKTFSETDVEKMVADALDKREKEKEVEFAEAEKKEKIFREREKDIEAREKKLTKRETYTKKAGIISFCEGLKKEGKLIPAWEDGGIQEFMEALCDEDSSFEFSKGEKVSQLDWFKSFLGKVPKVVEFSEIAGRGQDTGGGNAGEKLSVLVTKKMKELPDLNYSAAFSEVQKENPALTKQYATENNITVEVR